MNKKLNNLKNAGNWIGVGTAIGVAVFAATKNQLGLLWVLQLALLLHGRNRKIKI